MGVAQEPRLELLHHDVEVACGQLGVETEGRPFRPHLTLARVKSRSTRRANARARSGGEEDRATTPNSPFDPSI